MDRGLSQCLGLLELLFHGGSWESQLDRVVRDSHVGATTTTDIQRSFRWLVGGWLEPLFFLQRNHPPNLRCILGGGFKTFQIFIPIWGIDPN